MNHNVSTKKRTLINALLTVKHVNCLSNNLLRIVFSCDKPLKIDPLWIGPHLKLFFPQNNQDEFVFPTMNEDNKVIWQEGMRERVRTYSIRQYQAENDLLTVDFVVHEKGIATVWAQKAQVGDRIGLIAAGSKNRFDDNRQLILLGDISALPAISYTLEHLPENHKAIALVEVRCEQDRVAINFPSSIRLEWLVTPQGKDSQLISQLSKLNLENMEDNLLFWGGMESSVSQQVRRFLKDQLPHLSGDSIHLISYWREGFSEGEFKHHD